MEGLLNFSTSTNIKNLLGRDLVTDEITAVFELVKNSYDADATWVKLEFLNLMNGLGSIIIEDNGSGMDLDDIKRFWMVIGTDSKKDIKFSKKFKRALNGDKGIGRFSTDRLGKKLVLNSVKESSNDEIEIVTDWGMFEDKYGKLEEISIPYKISKVENLTKNGVRLCIKELRDIWSPSNIEKLIKNLRQLKSPISFEDNFDIIISVPEFNIHNYKIEPYDLESMSSLWANAEIAPENPSMINMTIFRNGITYEEQFKNDYTFGPVKSKIYFFDIGDKIKFNKKMKMSVKDFGNIRLYRDGFRIYPYGEAFNDWLDLNQRKNQGYSRFFATRELIGYVQITKEYNSNILATTNRQGIIDNNFASQLRDFIINYPIKALERYFFKKQHNDTFNKAKDNVYSAVDKLNILAKDFQKTSPETAKIIKQISEVVSKGQDEQAEFVKNQEEVLEVYKRVASKEMLLNRVIHQSLIKVKNIQSVNYLLNNAIQDVENENNQLNSIHLNTIKNHSSKIDDLSDEARSYLTKTRDYLINKKSKEKLNLNDALQKMINNFNEECLNYKIEIELCCPVNLYFYCDRNDLQVIVENFLSNSIKSLCKVSDRERLINVKVIEHQRNIIMIFKDNGIGIQESIRDRIFEPFFTTTNGFGIGLAIVDEIVKDYGGEVNLAVNYESGAEFQLSFRR